METLAKYVLTFEGEVLGEEEFFLSMLNNVIEEHIINLRRELNGSHAFQEVSLEVEVL